MKILFTIDTLGSGGKERRLTELLKALKVCKGYEIELALMSKDIHYSEVFDYGIRIHSIIRRIKKDPIIFIKFYQLINNCNPDIVHCFDSMTAVYVAPACKLLHCKLVNGMIIDSPVKQNIFNKHWLRGKITFPLSDIIVGNSESGLKAYKAPVKKNMVIYNGFNFKRITNTASKQTIMGQFKINTDYVVGMVATFWEKKDYPTYFNAAQLILNKRNDVTFLAIGSETDSERAVSLIDKRYAEFFRLTGKITGVETLINAMDICVLSTFTEGISNSIMEYMASGKPVVATRGGGTDEIVQDGETGFLVDPFNPVELAEKIELLLNDSQLRERMGLAGRERIEKYFSIDEMLRKYTELYKALATGQYSVAKN